MKLFGVPFLSVVLIASCAALSQRGSSFDLLVAGATRELAGAGYSALVRSPVPFAQSPDFRGAAAGFERLSAMVEAMPGYSEDACMTTAYRDLLPAYGCDGVIALEAVRISKGIEDRATFARQIDVWREDVFQFPSEENCLDANRPTGNPVEVTVDGVYRVAWYNRACRQAEIYVRGAGWIDPATADCEAPSQDEVVSAEAREVVGLCRRR